VGQPRRAKQTPCGPLRWPATRAGSNRPCRSGAFLKKSQILANWLRTPARHPAHRVQFEAQAFERQPLGWRKPPRGVTPLPEQSCSTPRLPSTKFRARIHPLDPSQVARRSWRPAHTLNCTPIKVPRCRLPPCAGGHKGALPCLHHANPVIQVAQSRWQIRSIQLL
jgi:hypothetical protein